MAQTLNIAHSLEYRLWQILFQAGWKVPATGVNLVPVAGAEHTYAVPEIRFRWVFLDSSGKNTSNEHVKVYRNGDLVPSDQYSVDFEHGQIIFASPIAGTLTADITYFAATVREGYPDPDELNLLTMSDLPIIAYAIEAQDARPFAIGDGRRDRWYNVTVDLLTTDKTQTKLLTDDLMDRLPHVGLLDTSAQWVLTPIGTANVAFNFDDQLSIYLRVDDLRSITLKPRLGGSDKERNRALVTCTIKNVS